MNLLATLLILFSHAVTIKPTTNTDLRKVTVKITTPQQNAGGTGSILQSGIFGSHVLTNKHVCESIQKDWIIAQNNKGYRISRYKLFDRHDLCIVETKANLGVSLKIAGRFPKLGDTSIVSGHPMMLPHTVTRGHFSDELKIDVVVDVRECTEDEFKQDPMGCGFFGKLVTEEYEAQYTSNLIQPGNSGSAVFNEKGELTAVVFAGVGDLGFTFTVPLLYVNYFISNNSDYPWITPTDKKADTKNKEKAIREFIQFCITNKFNPTCLQNKRDLMMR